jgi:S1-C subfamily serine protease
MGTEARIVSRDAENDLALLKADWNSKNFVQFRSGMLVEIGEPVMAFGFPLPGTLSSDGVATNGIVNALTGIHDDPGTLQFSAAVQPGNSGGPLFDGGGHVIGVVEAKLDSLRMAQTLGVIPENVGFAIQWDRIEGFLKNADVKPSLATSSNSVTSTDIAQFARRVTVSVDCVQ